MGDSGSETFEWVANVRVGGAFPSGHEVTIEASCVRMHRQVDDVFAIFAPATARFASVALENDDIFIPIAGQATVGKQFSATAALQPASETSPNPRVTIETNGGDAPRSFPDLAAGNAFPWGPYRATLVRIVPPNDAARYGEIGWAEIRLERGALPSDAGPTTSRARAAP